MYKIIGMLLVGGALSGFLYNKAQTMSKEYENLKEMIKALTYLKQELSFSAGELWRVCRTIANRTKNDVSEAFLKTANILEEKPSDFYTSWSEATQGVSLFSKEAQSAISDLIYNLGKKSLDIELENIEKTKEILEQTEIYEREKTAKDKKLLYTLGVSAGLALVILSI